MPKIIPFDDTGSREITVELGENVFRMKTYFLPYISRWILDINDNEGNPVLLGICLNVGVENLVKGKTSIFEGQAIRCISLDGTENDTPTSLGNTCVVEYYEKGEEVPSLHKDKMLG